MVATAAILAHDPISARRVVCGAPQVCGVALRLSAVGEGWEGDVFWRVSALVSRKWTASWRLGIEDGLGLGVEVVNREHRHAVQVYV